ncbi:terminase large subunit domain-containing protein [Bradyrhizobium sp. 33ap4]|uniref:terminase large subunit domain-containing protein n=1 Tax=Bradyrhizobium sp. 33ap4 TaxID=3061630 RepID=UPI00292EF649|nr:terminase family protein [Bradyrhizobium sp. 33ap4]
MPAPNKINPRTGKRFDFVDPAHQDAEVVALRRQVAVLERADAATLARERFMPFIKFTSPDPEAPNDVKRSRYKNARHHDATARALEEVEKANYEFLILVEPPRHGKSEQVSRRLPPWYIGRHPNHNVVVATYSDEFAEDFGANVRAIMNSPAYKQVFPEVKLTRGGTAKARLETTAGGLLFFVGRGGALTGRGAHLLICDDLIKDAKEAASPAVRNQAWEWFTKVAMTRRMGKKLVILTFTRWHADDPIGRLTDPENPHYNARLAKKIKIINMPAIAEENDPLGRKPGEPLWPDGPDKFDLNFLQEQQDLDPLGFAALYQGRPSALDGDLFKRENVRYYTKDELPLELRKYAASDHALGQMQRNDPTLMLSVGISRQNDIYIMPNIFWRRAPTDTVTEAMLNMAEVEKPLLWWAGRDHITKSIGPFLRKRMNERGVYINIREVPTIGDKVQGAQSIIGRFAMGKVYWPKEATWVERAIAELLSFPNGLHDEWADTLGLIGRGMESQVKPGRSATERAPKRPSFGTVAWLKMQDKWSQEKAAERAAGGF